MKTRTISINRAPVLTLWAAVVAQRLGFDEDEALTLGKALAGLNAQSKGRRLGIFKPHEEKAKKARDREQGERFLIEVCGRAVPAMNTGDGIRAVRGGKPIDPDSVRRYLDNKFSDNLKAVRIAMQKLTRAYKPRCEPTAHRYYLTDSASFRFRRFGPTVHRSVLWRYAPFRMIPLMLLRASPKRRTTPAGNRQRSPRGGSHERRTRGSSSSHYPAPRRPIRPGHLCCRRPLRGLVPQVVAPLSGGQPRGPLRPDAG